MSSSTQPNKSKCSKPSVKALPPIVALPSMSSHLFSLPQAKNMESVPVHPSHSAQRNAESEAKLKKALERNIARQNSQPTHHPVSLRHLPRKPAAPPLTPHSAQPPRPLVPPQSYSEPTSPSSHSPPIMMRVSYPPTPLPLPDR